MATTAGVIVVLLLLLGAGSVAAWHWLIAPVQEMPSLEGRSETEARDTLNGLGLIPVVDRQHTMADPEGAVIGQDPPAGSELRRGSEVELIVSAGPATHEMIDVTGMRLGEAQAELENEPLFLEVVRIDESFHDEAPRGEVLEQSIAAGEAVEQGSPVVLRVSLGIEQVEVPDLSGMLRDEAQAALEQAGLAASFSEEYSDTVPRRGEVIAQSIEAEQEIDVDSTVEVTVSKGPRTIELPDLRGDAVGDAVAALEELDLEVNVIRQPRQRVGPFVRGEEGRVEEMDPQGGSSVQRGETVDVYTFDDDAED